MTTQPTSPPAPLQSGLLLKAAGVTVLLGLGLGLLWPRLRWFSPPADRADGEQEVSSDRFPIVQVPASGTRSDRPPTNLDRNLDGDLAGDLAGDLDRERSPTPPLAQSPPAVPEAGSTPVRLVPLDRPPEATTAPDSPPADSPPAAAPGASGANGPQAGASEPDRGELRETLRALVQPSPDAVGPTRSRPLPQEDHLPTATQPFPAEPAVPPPVASPAPPADADTPRTALRPDLPRLLPPSPQQVSPAPPADIESVIPAPNHSVRPGDLESDSEGVTIPVIPPPASPLSPPAPALDALLPAPPALPDPVFPPLDGVRLVPVRPDLRPEMLSEPEPLVAVWQLLNPAGAIAPEVTPDLRPAAPAPVWQLDGATDGAEPGLSLGILSSPPILTPVWELVLVEPLTPISPLNELAAGAATAADADIAAATVAPLPETIPQDSLAIVGNTVFSEEELLALPLTQAGEALPAELSLAQLLQISERITQAYVAAGYVSSGAFVPNDALQPDGTVVIQVVEGELEAINVARSPQRSTSLINHPSARFTPFSSLDRWAYPDFSRDRVLITGNRPLNLGYVRRRLAAAGGAPLNLNRLLTGVQLLQVDPLVETISTEIGEGTQTGTSVLDVSLTEAPTTSALVSVDNSRSPSVGSVQQRAAFTQANLLGFGDRLTLGYSRTEGSSGWDIGYAIPFNTRNGTISLTYGSTDSEVIEDPFNFLDIQSESRFFELTLRQPVVQTPSQELALSLTASRRETASEFLEALFGEAEPFPSTGADADGETRISALRFAQEWTRQGSRQVFALRSEFSLGLEVFNATVNPIRPDSRFFSWRGQGQWVRQLGRDRLLLLRGEMQLADGPLVPTEQFGLGGLGTIRGYRQDTLLTDNGWLASAEVRLPILRIPQWDSVLQIAPFVEVGQGWNPKEPDPLDNTLASTGLGLLWRQGDRFSARLDWGIPLTGTTSTGGSFQEDGFHFTIRFSPF